MCVVVAISKVDIGICVNCFRTFCIIRDEPCSILSVGNYFAVQWVETSIINVSTENAILLTFSYRVFYVMITPWVIIPFISSVVCVLICPWIINDTAWAFRCVENTSHRSIPSTWIIGYWIEQRCCIEDNWGAHEDWIREIVLALILKHFTRWQLGWITINTYGWLILTIHCSCHCVRLAWILLAVCYISGTGGDIRLAYLVWIILKFPCGGEGLTWILG